MENIDIVLINETWLKKSITFSGYNIYQINRADGYGGVAIMVKNNIISRQILYNISIDPIEAVFAEVICTNTTIKICSIYIPPNLNTNIVQTNFKNLIDCLQQNSNTIIGGDFNALHPIWDNTNRYNGRGQILADIITQSHFHVLNNGLPTRQNLFSNTSSAIDVTCSSPDISNRISWEITNVNLGSDHIPILLKIQLDNSQNTPTKKNTYSI